MNINDLQTLIEQFMRVTNTINELHKHAISLNGSMPLTLGEIHLIECIGKHPETNVTEIAKILGNTRGAVSQMAKKLENKELINKTKKGDNDKEIILQLNKNGMEIFLEHEKFHASLYGDIFSSIEGATKENIEFVKSILNKIEEHTDEYKKKYQ